MVEFSLFTIILHERMKVALNEVLEEESDPCSGVQMLHLCKQCGKSPCKVYRDWRLAEQTLAPTLDP